MTKSLIIFSSFLFLNSSLSYSQKAEKPSYVLFIGVDGLGGYAFGKTNMPVLEKLCNQGSYTFKARSVYPSSSSPNWASMIMGAPPRKTKIPQNGFDIKKATEPSFCGRKSGQFWPSIYTLLHEQQPNKRIVLLHHWDDYSRFVNKAEVELDLHTRTEDSTALLAVQTINKGMPDLMFLHFDNVDHAGHTYGHRTPRYYQDVQKTDSLIGVVLEALKAKGIYEKTLIIVTADHGGRGKHHGWITEGEMNIPWIISGSGVKKNHRLKDKSIKTYDTAATLAYFFGLTVPECWDGKPVLDAFEN